MIDAVALMVRFGPRIGWNLSKLKSMRKDDRLRGVEGLHLGSPARWRNSPSKQSDFTRMISDVLAREADQELRVKLIDVLFSELTNPCGHPLNARHVTECLIQLLQDDRNVFSDSSATVSTLALSKLDRHWMFAGKDMFDLGSVSQFFVNSALYVNSDYDVQENVEGVMRYIGRRECLTQDPQVVPAAFGLGSRSDEDSFTSPNMCRGGLGEPYCSVECYTQAGESITAALLQNSSGLCGFCQQPVTLGIGEEDKMIPFREEWLFACPTCAEIHLEPYIREMEECCMCSKMLS